VGVEGEVGSKKTIFSGNNRGASGSNNRVEKPDVGAGTNRGEIKVDFGGGGYAAKDG